MKWRGRRQSDNIEDRRGQGGGMRFPGGMRIPTGRVGRGGFGGGLGIVILIVLALIFGFDPSVLLQTIQPGPDGGRPNVQVPRQNAPARNVSKEEAALKQFVAVVLADTEDAWRPIFAAKGGTYREPKLVLYRGMTRTACGFGQAAAGPFYCPGDQRVYLDLRFAEELSRRFRAPGDFALAYVIAHEVGHHVQTLVGVAQKVQAARQRAGRAEGNRLQVMMELQADCYAGVWTHHVQRKKKVLEEGDIEEAIRAASAVGDDTIQRRTQGYVVPDAFTHGSAEQRVRWFRRGFRSGNTADCNTFSANQL